MIELKNWVFETFGNREISTAFWVIAGLGYCIFSKSIRPAFFQLLGFVKNKHILILFASFAANTVVLSLLFEQLGLWTRDQIPQTCLWYMLSTFPLLSGTFDAKESDQYFRGILLGSITVFGAFEFLVVLFNFALWIELVLVPVLFILGMMLALSEQKDEHRIVKNLLLWIFGIFGAFLLWKSFGQIWSSPKEFFNSANGRNFLLPGIFAIGSIPLLYFWHCVSHIQNASVRIGMKTFQSDDLKRYAKKRFFLIFALRPWLLRRAVRQFQIIPATDQSDIDQIIQEIYRHEREAETPPEVDPSEGWSPYLAREFLKDHGLRTGDYHQHYDNDWWAESEFVDLDDGVLPNKASFYMFGSRDVVHRLKLKTHIMRDQETPETLINFLTIAQALLAQTAPDINVDPDEFVKDEVSFVGQLTKVHILREGYPDGRGFELSMQVGRPVRSDKQ